MAYSENLPASSSMCFSLENLSASLQNLSLVGPNTIPPSSSLVLANNSLFFPPDSSGNFLVPSVRTSPCYFNTLGSATTLLQQPLMPPPLSNSVAAAHGFSTINNGQFNNGVYYGNMVSPNLVQDQDNLNSSFLRYATTEEGWKTIQGFLNPRDQKLTRAVLSRCMKLVSGTPVIIHLMNDQHGWYVFSKLFESCDIQQKKLIVGKITSDERMFLDVALTKYGSTSVVKMIKMIKRSDLVYFVVKILADGFCRVMTEKTGLNVLSECLDQLDHKWNKVLYNAAIQYCLVLATHKQGCISLNKFIDKMVGGFERDCLLEAISSNAVFLSFDPLGNYVVQKVLSLENPIYTEKITMLLKGHYVQLALQRAGSHLVEKCLNSRQGMECVVGDLLRNIDQLLLICRDKFGNYVIQSVLKATTKLGSPLHFTLLTCLQQNLRNLESGFGRNIGSLITEGVPLNNKSGVTKASVSSFPSSLKPAHC